MRNQLLRDSDWASMVPSLEIRTMLVDAQLLQALAPVLVTSGNISQKKSLLAQSPVLPLYDRIIDRKKTGFGVPMHNWLEKTTASLDAWRKIPLLAQPGCHWARRFALYMILVLG